MAISWRVPALLLAGLVAVLLAPAESTVALWVLLVLVLAGVDVLLAPSPRTLRIERLPLTAVRQGEPTTTTLELSAPRGLHGVVRDAWTPSAGAQDNRHRVALPRGGTATLRTTLVPTRRGDRPSDRVTVRSFGPLRLGARQRSLEVPGRLRALPSFPSRRHLPSRLARLRELDGRAAVRVRGQGTEFDSLREYVRGDDLRSVDWRSTARSKAVMVRTWQPERDRRVVIVLDTGRTSAARLDDVPRLDAEMDAALLLAALAGRAGDRIDFVAGDRSVRCRVKGGHRGDVLERMQDAMSTVEPELAETSWQALGTAVSAMGRHRALVVLLTPLDRTSVEQGLLPLLAAWTGRHRVVLASVHDPALDRLSAARGDTDEVYLAAAAERVRLDRERTGGLLKALGVDVLDASADALPVALADHYLSLKARGLL